MELGQPQGLAEVTTPPPALNADSPSVQSHLTLLQGVIARMASNSASSKTWCVSLVSALAVVVAQSGQSRLLLIAALPIILFGVLDAYYLGLERAFRRAYDEFVRKLHNGSAIVDDAFTLTPAVEARDLLFETITAAKSFSVWPFYVGLGGILWWLGQRLQ